MSNMPEPVFQRRQRRKDHYHQLDKTLLFAYPNLSDGARLTYIVLDAYDWPDATGTSKGYVFPYQSTLARVRGTSLSTIKRHLAELQAVGLITVEVLKTADGRRNRYWIEDASQAEFERYLETMAKGQCNGGQLKNELMGGVKNELMGQLKNELYKDTNGKDTKKDKDKTCLVGSGPNSFDDAETAIFGMASNIDQSLEEIINRNMSQSELSHLERLVATYGVDDVQSTLNELLVQREMRTIKDPVRYIEGVLLNWQREGRRTTDIIAHIRKLSSKLDKAT